MSFGIVSQPAGGVVVLDDAITGAFTYTPNIGTSGYDPFTFQVNDGSSAIQDTQMVFVVVSPQWPGQTIRASVAANGGQPNGSSRAPSISADGRYVAFESLASNLATGGGGASHVYLRDRLTGMTTIHSRATAGVTGTVGNSRTPAISADGRYLAFQSFSSNLVPGDSNNLADVFVRDLLTGAITRVNLSSAGLQATGGASSRPSISADGRYVAFESAATNLVADDTNGRPDIFVHDRETGGTMRVSVASDGAQAVGTSTNGSTFATISADGRFVAFESAATNLVPGDGNNAADVFVHDRVTGTTMLVSASVTGSSGNFGSGEPAISADGRVVLFRSHATDLLPAGVDTNLSPDAFVRDLVSGETTRVSVSSDGVQGNATINGTEINTSVSADGRYAVFMSNSAALVPGDTNGHEDVFVHDRLTRTTTRVSVTDGGDQTVPGVGNSNAWPSISADGRFIAFQSSATNFVAGDNLAVDIFVVGGVSVTPLRREFVPDGGADTIQVAFTYPGTAWTAASNVDWITISGPTGGTGDGTVTYTVAPNPGDPRTGTLTVATQTVTIEQAATRAAQAPLTITGAPASARVGTTFTVSTQGGSGTGDVQFTASGACSNESGGALITMTAGTGSCVIGAEKAADANYLAASAPTVTVSALPAVDLPDYVVTALSNPPTQLAAGLAFAVTETTSNQGTKTATQSTTTRFYLSPNPDSPAGGTLLTGVHSVPALAAGTSANGSLQVTIPLTAPAGTFWLLACADATAVVAESNEGNNCLTAAQQIEVQKPDLTITSVSEPPETVSPGSTITATDTTANIGNGTAGASATRYYLSTDRLRNAGDVLLTGSRSVAGLAPGLSSSGSKAVTVPAATSLGAYYLLACADGLSKVSEADESNNCAASTRRVVVDWPDLVVQNLSAPPAIAVPGQSFTLTHSVKNQGLAAAASSTAKYSLSVDGIADASDIALGTATVAALLPGQSQAISKSLKIPLTAPTGTFVVLVCADDATKVAESNETNNCQVSSSIEVRVPDLVIGLPLTAPTTASASQAINVTVTTSNIGTIKSASSTTRFYLSPVAEKSASAMLFVATVSVPALSPAASSTTTRQLTVPAVAPGSYYLLACADDLLRVREVDENNNCRAQALQIMP